jgi:hypothetical protein
MLKKYSTYNKSYYTLKITKGKKTNLKKATVHLLFYDSKKNPLKNHPVWIKNGCDKIFLDKGEMMKFSFHYDTVTDMPIRFAIDAFGFSSIDTNPIKIEENDSVVVKFYLAEPDDPILNCQ